MLDKMRANAQSWAIKALFTIIILAFIITFAAPHGKGRDSVARVYEETIPADRFVRSIPREAEDQPDIKRTVLYRLINRMLLIHKADELGLTPSDQMVARAITSMPEFQTDGRFNLDRYKAALGNAPSDFEQSIKDDISTSRLQGFATLAARPTEAEARAVFDWQNEFVSLDYLPLSPTDFLSDVEVNDNRIQEYYDEHKDEYKKPASISLKLVRFTPQALAVLQDVTDGEIQHYYDEMKGTLMSERTYCFRQLLIPVPVNPSGPEVAKLQAKALEVYKALRDGADFDKLAAQWTRKGGIAPDTIEVPESVLPKPLAMELERMSPGQIGEPVGTAGGLMIPRLEDIRQPRQLTLNETRDKIRTQLAEEKASSLIDDILDKTIGQISQGKDLDAISKDLNLTMEERDPLTREDLVNDFGLNDEAVDTLFALAPGTSTRTPLLMQGGGYLLAEKLKDLPEEIQPLDTIRAKVTAEFTMSRAQQMARDEAQELLTAIGDPTADHDKALRLYRHLIVSSEPFGRGGPIPGLAADPKLIQDAFAAPVGTWLPLAYATSTGIVLARVNQHIPASEELWRQQKDDWMQATAQFNANVLLQGLSQSLLDAANADHEIDILRPDLLN